MNHNKCCKIIPLFVILLLSKLAIAQVTVEEVSTVDASNQAAWWVPLALFNDETYFAFNTPGSTYSKHRVKVAKRDNNGNWTENFLRNADGSIWEHDDDNGHDQPTIAIDGDGYIHVFADHHNDNWRYFRSASAGSLSDLRLNTDLNNNGGTYTYPVATTAPNGDIYLIIRDANPDYSGKGKLFHWNDNSNAWSLVTIFANQNDTAVYPDDVVVDSYGDVHIIWEWSYDVPRPDRHYGSYLVYEPATGLFRTADGSIVNTPVNLSTPGLFYQGLEPGENFASTTGKMGMQSAKLALGDDNNPTILYRYRTDATSSGSRDYEVFRIRWNGSSWVGKTSIYNSTDTIAALGHTKVGDRVRAYYVNSDKQLMVAEKTGGGNWQHYYLAADKAIERVNVKAKDETLDVVYASAPTAINSTSGKLYAILVGNDLSGLQPPVTFEAEDLPHSSSAAISNINDPDASNGKYLIFEAPGAGDWIEFILPDLNIGTYTLTYRYKTHASRGIATTEFNSNGVGAAVDQYADSANWQSGILGNVNVSSAGNAVVTFNVSGKNLLSSNYRIAIDSITLVP